MVDGRKRKHVTDDDYSGNVGYSNYSMGRVQRPTSEDLTAELFFFSFL